MYHYPRIKSLDQTLLDIPKQAIDQIVMNHEIYIIAL